MDVVLRSNVPNVGLAGEVVKVKDGYARNFLIPRGLAFEATAANKRRIEAEATHRASRHAADEATARELAARLAQVAVTIPAKAGEGDRLFGSITTSDIAAALAPLGFTVDKRAIELEEPIRTLGPHQVPIRLHPAVRADLRVTVVRE